MSQSAAQKSRVASEKKIDLRAIVIPPKIWQPQQRCERKIADQEGSVVGFMRLPPDVNLRNLREEVSRQLDETAFPLDYIFLRCVGDFLTVVSKKQEMTLKAKSYAPPYTSTPDMYVISAECVSPQLVNSLRSPSRSSLTSPVMSPTPTDNVQLGAAAPQALPGAHTTNTAGLPTSQGHQQSSLPQREYFAPPSPATQAEHDQLFASPNPLLHITGSRGELPGGSSDPINYLGTGTASSLSTGFDLQPPQWPHFSISLSPTPGPHPPSEPRDPSIPRSPLLERKRRSQIANPQPGQPAVGAAVLEQQYASAIATSSVPPSLTSYGSSQSTTAGASSMLSMGSPEGLEHSSFRYFEPGSQQYQDATTGGEPAGGGIQVLLNQGSNDISLQLGGQSSLLPAISPAARSPSPMLPRLDIRIGGSSRSSSALPPIGLNGDTTAAALTMRLGNEVPFEREPSPAPLGGSRDVFAARESAMILHQQTVELLKGELAEKLRARERHDKRKKELQDRSSQLEGESHRQKQSADEDWKKKYLQEKRRTGPIENQLDDMRKKFATLHNKPAVQRGRQAMKDASKIAASEANNNRNMAKKLEKELTELRGRIETLRVQLEREQAAHTQMAQECKQLRQELTDKKITKTLVKKP